VKVPERFAFDALSAFSAIHVASAVVENLPM
jgi:hypothetical protein